jgi:hypothetical protein
MHASDGSAKKMLASEKYPHLKDVCVTDADTLSLAG